MDPNGAASPCPPLSPPRFDAKQLERQKRGLTENFYRQEFECEFVDPSEALFPTELLLRALTPDVEPLWIWSKL